MEVSTRQPTDITVENPIDLFEFNPTWPQRILGGEKVGVGKGFATRVKAAPVVNVHGVDNPGFDPFEIHQFQCPRCVSDKLEPHFRIGADDHAEPVKCEILLRTIAFG